MRWRASVLTFGLDGKRLQHQTKSLPETQKRKRITVNKRPE